MTFAEIDEASGPFAQHGWKWQGELSGVLNVNQS
jgi:hypothetical protein